MTKASDGSETLFETIPPELLADPVEYFYVEHKRQRMACNLLQQQIDADAPDPKVITALRLYMSHDLALHVIDEESDLFPLLRRRAHPEDELESLLQQLSAEHARDEVLSKDLGDALDKMSTAKTLSRRSYSYKHVTKFIAAERRHLALENGALLPIARLRLTPKDLQALGQRMAARRGVDFNRILG